MVIAKSEWFARRKYSGWGLMPKTWQGGLYTLGILLITFLIVYLPLDIGYKITIMAIWAVLMAFDIGQAMIKIRDEREKIHEAIAERNALWAVILVIVVGISYQLASNTVLNDFSSLDPFLIVAVIVALVVKAASNIWLDRKD